MVTINGVEYNIGLDGLLSKFSDHLDKNDFGNFSEKDFDNVESLNYTSHKNLLIDGLSDDSVYKTLSYPYNFFLLEISLGLKFQDNLVAVSCYEDFTGSIKDKLKSSALSKDAKIRLEILQYIIKTYYYRKINPSFIKRELENKYAASQFREYSFLLAEILLELREFKEAYAYSKSSFTLDSNEPYKDCYWKCVQNFANDLLAKLQFIEFDELIEDVKKTFNFKSLSIEEYRTRLDYLALKKEIIIERNKIEIMKKENDSNTFKLIEVLGLFTSILAFIFINVGSAVFNQTMSTFGRIATILSSGLGLSLFAVLISYLFGAEKYVMIFNRSRNIKLLLLIIIVASTILFLLFGLSYRYCWAPFSWNTYHPIYSCMNWEKVNIAQ